MECNIRYVHDGDLCYYFQKLHRYLHKSAYFDSSDTLLKRKYKYRYSGINEHEQIEGTYMNILSAPARKVQNVAKKNAQNIPFCPLCLNLSIGNVKHPYNKSKALLWRNYIIVPNAFPYFKLHYLLMAPYHSEYNGTQNDAHNIPYVLGNAIEFLRIIGKGVILFNGWVGNSLGHLHFHYTTTNFPIRNAIKKHNILKKKFVTEKTKSIISIYVDKKNTCKNFIRVKGQLVEHNVFLLLQYISNTLKLFYNLFIEYNVNVCTVYIFVRKKMQDDTMNYGASNLAGLVLSTQDDIQKYRQNKKIFMESINKYCTETVKNLTETDIKRLFILEN